MQTSAQDMNAFPAFPEFDAVDRYASAQTKLITTLYDHKEARLNLEKAMGEVSES